MLRSWSSVGSIGIVCVDIGFFGRCVDVPWDLKRDQSISEGMLSLASYKLSMGPFLREGGKVGGFSATSVLSTWSSAMSAWVCSRKEYCLWMKVSRDESFKFCW